MKQAPEPGRGAIGELMFKPKKHNYKGAMLTVAELSRLTGIKEGTINYRLRRGKNIEEAVSSEPWQGSKKPRNQSAKPQKVYSCDAWGHDCFNCKLPDCNDDRPCRRNEVRYVPETEGIRTESNTATYTVLLGTNRK